MSLPKTDLSEGAIATPYGASRGLSVAESEFAPNRVIGEHTHRTGYLSFTLSGSVLDSLDTRHTAAAPGYACYVPAETPHANTFGSRGARCLLIELDNNALVDLREAGLDVLTPWSGFGGAAPWRAFKFYRALRNGAAVSLDVEEVVHTSFERRPVVRLRTSPRALWLARVRDMLEAALRRPPSIGELAREADVHPMHLIRAFRMRFGCSPGEYVQTRRIARACRLLLETHLPLARVALKLGFHDQSHFTRAFSARVGVAPGQYRLGRSGDRQPLNAPAVQTVQRHSDSRP
jgi:AraC family transcriptional regulator